MVEITPDSPVAAVFGRQTNKRARVTEGLGLETVGDLLHHFPRRYVALTELSEVGVPEVGQTLTVVGEITNSRVATFSRNGRRQYRAEVRVRTAGPEFAISFFSPYAGQAEKTVADFPVGSRGLFVGVVKRFGSTWQLDKPHGQPIDADGVAEGRLPGLMPVYPLTAKLTSWDLQQVIGTTLDLVTGVTDVFDTDLRERYGLVDVMTALRWMHAPDDHTQLGTARKRFRFAEALVLQLVLAQRRAERRAQGSTARTGQLGDLLAALTPGSRSS